MKAIVTVVGKDRVGIIAGVCTELANFNVNVLDINQTVMQGYFTMMMAVDVPMRCWKALSGIPWKTSPGYPPKAATMLWTSYWGVGKNRTIYPAPPLSSRVHGKRPH